MAAVTYAYYSNTYGGGLSEPAFADSLPVAEVHVKWLCANRCYCPTSTAFKRAVCAAVDAFDIPAGSRVTVQGHSFAARKVHRCEDLFGRCHYWEIEVG